MTHTKNNYQHQQLRRHRNRMRVLAHAKNPILIVFRSAKHISAQIIDSSGKILASATDAGIKGKMTKTARAAKVGETIAKISLPRLKAGKASPKAGKASPKAGAIAFDRGQYRYHGRVKALATAARKGGLKF